jgi:hypothetical protein
MEFNSRPDSKPTVCSDSEYHTTRVHAASSDSSQPSYAWLAQAPNLRPTRFTGLRGPVLTAVGFLGNCSLSWPTLEEKPVKNGLECFHQFVDIPAVKRLAFTFDTSRANAACAKTSVRRRRYFTNFNNSSSVHAFWRSAVAERTSRTVESSTGWASFPQARRM